MSFPSKTREKNCSSGHQDREEGSLGKTREGGGDISQTD